MNISLLYSLQKQLDERIQKEHNLVGADVVHEKLLALIVEVGELANETRCFKYWSKKAPSQGEVILEEYVDGLHFILSIGISFQFEFCNSEANQVNKADRQMLTKKFIQVFEAISVFQSQQELSKYTQLFNTYLELGKMLGFTLEQIEKAYLIKNQVNHVRQDTGY